ncbi:sensor histidine kinase [Nonomuraea pusilla]|uniref:histidine kinase n=1 Tax=Nonomuraea pusilla TaxID=46177 RepID=A0A1H8C2A0_9ACTN|nr:HAMP domain-containing sensor histidine kinase [Nonomuraea pusilla]SEM89112.1 Signal transduction histidine kinase [Nonomuraea pusilla]
MILLRNRSVRTRLTLLSSAVMALLCAGISALVLAGVRDSAAHRQTDEVLHDAVLRVAHQITRGRPLPRVIRSEEIDVLQVVGPDGRVVAAAEPMAGRPRISAFTPPEENLQVHRTVCDAPGFHDTCMNVVSMRLRTPSGHWTVYGAEPVVPWYVDHLLMATLVGGSLLLVGATTIGAYRTVGRTLDPVEAISGELQEITSTDLERRVPVPGHHDEIQRLALTVNQTLDRLQAAVERERRFASDASHDLRSPITAMRTQVEEALLHPEDADWPSMARAQLAGLDRLQAIVTDLLALCRMDAGAASADQPLDLGELVGAELARRVPQKAVVTDIRPGAVVTGDRLQLIRMFTNLVDNAERHAASSVAVEVRPERGQVVLEVRDDGPGIPVEQREYVFQRFTRLDTARNRETGGTGLGLAIARQIAERHHGTLALEDSPCGARFVARLPLAPAPP